MKSQIAKILNKLPYIKGLRKDLDNYEKWGLPGHFYNPIPSVEELKEYEENLFTISKNENDPGLDFNFEGQKINLQYYKEYYKEIPFPEVQSKNFLYYFLNPNYSYSDAIFTYCTIRHFKPKRIIEIGSGYSSCLFLDTNKVHFNNKINCTFIEPYPQLLINLIDSQEGENIKIIPSKVQGVDLKIYMELEENDILFIDSSHVVKTGSDLQFIFFKIIPILKKGVLLHFHDIFFPFEYPKDWLLTRFRAWNEIYMLKAFLMYNKEFEIVAFNTMLEEKMPEWFNNNMPLCLKNKGGSIWIQKRK